jgi:hypothetical protein
VQPRGIETFQKFRGDSTELDVFQLAEFPGWYPHPESNRDLTFRKRQLYPFELWGPPAGKIDDRKGPICRAFIAFDRRRVKLLFERALTLPAGIPGRELPPGLGYCSYFRPSSGRTHVSSVPLVPVPFTSRVAPTRLAR